MKIVKHFTHFLIVGIVISILFLLSKGEVSEQLFKYIAFLSVGVGVVNFVEIVIKSTTTTKKIVFYILDAILVASTLVLVFLNKENLVKFIPYSSLAILGLYSIYGIFHYLGSMDNARKNRRGWFLAVSIFLIKVLVVWVIVLTYLYVLALPEGTVHEGYVKLVNTTLIISFSILALNIIGIIFSLVKNKGFKKEKYPDEVIPKQDAENVRNVVYRISRKYSRTYHHKRAICYVKVNGKVNGRDINYLISGSAKYNGKISSPTDAELYSSEASDCFKEVGRQVMENTRVAVTNAVVPFAINVDFENIDIKPE